MSSTRAVPPALPEPDSVCTPGPWQHRVVSTNGIHLHVADVLPDNWEERHQPGELPHLVLFIHGYAENWWIWRHLLKPVATAGFHAMSVDLRGYGNSDKPPEGYDLPTAAEDIYGLIRATGHHTATIVAQGLGGAVAWTLANKHPEHVTELVLVSSPHPRVYHDDPIRRSLSGRTFPGQFISAQLPRLSEWRMKGDIWVKDYLSSRTRKGWLETREGAETLDMISMSLRIPKVAYCANEYLRWISRAYFRPDGWDYYKKMDKELPLRATIIVGAQDDTVSGAALEGSEKYVEQLNLIQILNAGYFPQLEQADEFEKILLDTLIH